MRKIEKYWVYYPLCIFTSPIFVTNGCEITIENVLNQTINKNGIELFDTFSKQSDKYNFDKVSKF